MTVNINKQVKSKKRVADHGEVFTSVREVNAMLDLVKQETERIESRFLEPACGTGNFLVAVLERKLNTVSIKYSKNIHEFEKYAFLAVSSIYGVELLEDNASECVRNLFDLFMSRYLVITRNELNQDFINSIKYVLNRNILCGDALTLLDNNRNPIVFSEWSLITRDYVKRRDFRLDEMLDGHKEMDLFMSDWEYDNETKLYIPKPIKEFKPIEFWRVNENDDK